MATSRINDLVGSVKDFSFTDHAPTPELVDIRRAIREVTRRGSRDAPFVPLFAVRADGTVTVVGN